MTSQLAFIFNHQNAHREFAGSFRKSAMLAKRIAYLRMARVRFGRTLFPGLGGRCLTILGLLVAGALRAVAQTGAAPSVEELAAENRQLQAQVDRQQKIIDALEARMDALEQQRGAANSAGTGGGATNSAATSGAAANNAAAESAATDSAPGGRVPPSEGGTVRLSGEVGLAYFQSGSDGQFSNGEFRVDEARIYLEAPVWANVFFHSETDLVTREAVDNNLHFATLYADIEGLPNPWGDDKLANLRVGRIDIPFGEEYQVRDVMENVLISHSLSDVWGMDGGVEGYGSAGRVSYVAALMDGGNNILHNDHSSKSAAGRIGYSGADWWTVSASAMRTGRLSSAGDPVSAVWFGSGFFRSLGPGATRYWADLYEADAALKWKTGTLKGAAGLARYNDNAPVPVDSRRINYYYIEGTQNLLDRLYGSVRYSAIHAPGGYYLEGQGGADEYYFGSVLTTQLERLSVGLGYRFGDPLVLKVEYSPEWGQTVSSGPRDGENLFSSELGFKF
jgi:hypothetical protein